ncbi:MAG: CehA/McbA family metallohydrolase [Fuerstiella sp.]|nr:CehA/McbA family metallohydrolase [Fuerstiella sp.]MCP4505770.1 CehA/McbA family metallohydrolase [Fuerstiella sp.]
MLFTHSATSRFRIPVLPMMLLLAVIVPSNSNATDITRPAVDGQPLAANASRLLDALKYLGHPLPKKTERQLRTAIKAESSDNIQRLFDQWVLFAVSINPELRVKVARGPGDPVVQQGGYTPVLVKVINDATVTRRLQISSPQAGPVYAGTVEAILKRQAQTELKINENMDGDRRFLDVEIFDQSPMTSRLSGLQAEYLLALVYSSEAGQREATIVFDIGEGTQDLGFRSEVPVLFSVAAAVPVKLKINDFDGQPTTARLEIRDGDGRIYPPQAKRLAPDFFFQPQIYRKDRDVVLLPPGEFDLVSNRGPEYLRSRQKIMVTEGTENVIDVRLKRWIDPMTFGFYCGDHHIHGAGCSHYDNPTQGVTPQDMFAQVKGEGLNVGCVLTWGPCFDFQRNYFSPIADIVSEPFSILKYDLEISGFGSAALGHVCLLNLKNQTYPGSDGTSTKGWPRWTVPVMRWAKEQGGVTGYPHSALHVDPQQAARWQISKLDADASGTLSADEAAAGLLAEEFKRTDEDTNGQLTPAELQNSANRAADTLPNVALPSMNGGGAMEIFVSTSEGVCDFISAMDTARIPEWNTWYHLMNCGFPLKLSGETDFPCMSSRRVGQGRVYVQLGDITQVSFPDWCRGIAAGQSYVSDGYAHAVKFSVDDRSPGRSDIAFRSPASVTVRTSVSFAPEQPNAVAYGTLPPSAGRRMVGDTVHLHAPRDSGYIQGGQRLVEVVVNGRVAASKSVAADGKIHDLEFSVPIPQSSWVAVRQFPQLHTNPVNVIIDNQPIRASRESALWCAESVRLLWHNRRRFISETEQPAAKIAYTNALEKFFRIAGESDADERKVIRFSLE